jgi:hypothetical protein
VRKKDRKWKSVVVFERKKWKSNAHRTWDAFAPLYVRPSSLLLYYDQVSRSSCWNIYGQYNNLTAILTYPRPWASYFVFLIYFESIFLFCFFEWMCESMSVEQLTWWWWIDDVVMIWINIKG